MLRRLVRKSRVLLKAMAGGSSTTSSAGSEILLYVVSTAVSCIVLLIGLRHLDPNRAQAKLAAERKKEIARRLGRPLLQTNVYEDIIACDVVNPDDITVTFDSIGGLDSVKRALYELVILPLKRPELFARGRLLRPQKGVLLYGPPGTGKTLLAKAIAKESSACFINVRIATLMSKWFGDAQKLVTAVFTLAYKLQPSIIFIDEVDSFLGQRKTSEHEAMTNMKTEFMSLWDGFTTNDSARVMVLAATNRPWELDEAILRRLPRSFEIGMPDMLQRASILKVILKGEDVEEDVDVMRLAALTEGYSGSDLQELCKQAAYAPIRDLLEEERQAEPSESREIREEVPAESEGIFLKGPMTAKPRSLRLADFEGVLRTSRPSKDVAYDYRLSRDAAGASGSFSNGYTVPDVEIASSGPAGTNVSPEFIKLLVHMFDKSTSGRGNSQGSSAGSGEPGGGGGGGGGEGEDGAGDNIGSGRPS